jgi:hypothetical protein
MKQAAKGPNAEKRAALQQRRKEIAAEKAAREQQLRDLVSTLPCPHAG